MSGAMPLPYALMAWTGMTIFFNIFCMTEHVFFASVLETSVKVVFVVLLFGRHLLKQLCIT